MQERESQALAGSSLGEWYAPDITSDPKAGIGGWSRAELTTYLKTGRVAGKAGAAGAMAEAITHSLSQLTDADLQAIASYLASVQPATKGTSELAAFAWGSATSSEPTLRGARVQPEGASLYSGLCASCHGAAGQGTPDHVIASLFHNSTVGSARADNLIAVILHGVDREAGGSHANMPGFAADSYVQPLADAQVAAVANYVSTTFGQGSSIVAADVAMARRGGPRSPLLNLPIVGASLALLIVLVALVWRGISRSRRKEAP